MSQLPRFFLPDLAFPDPDSGHRESPASRLARASGSLDFPVPPDRPPGHVDFPVRPDRATGHQDRPAGPLESSAGPSGPSAGRFGRRKHAQADRHGPLRAAAGRDAPGGEPRVLHVGGPVAHQISRVLRLRAGDRIIVLDGRGSAWEAELREVGRDAVAIELGPPAPCAPEPSAYVTLFAAVLKGDRQDWLIQKAVELGVSRIQPLLCARGVVKGSAPDRTERWQRIAREAAEQCERGIVPQVADPVPLERATWGGAMALICTERQGQPLLAVLQALQAHPGIRRLAVFVGPEGGWTPEEVSALLARGALAVSLGPRVLRAETAALAALAGLMLASQPETWRV